MDNKVMLKIANINNCTVKSMLGKLNDNENYDRLADVLNSYNGCYRDLCAANEDSKLVASDVFGCVIVVARYDKTNSMKNMIPETYIATTSVFEFLDELCTFEDGHLAEELS